MAEHTCAYIGLYSTSVCEMHIFALARTQLTMYVGLGPVLPGLTTSQIYCESLVMEAPFSQPKLLVFPEVGFHD